MNGKRKTGATVMRLRIKHGHHVNHKPSPTYASWHGMLQRCLNPNNKRYYDYGGRGITVCERWRDFQPFLADMGERPTGSTLDRIDNNRGYEPGNCRWATRREQYFNRRHHRMVETPRGKMTVTEAAERFGVKRQTLFMRLNRGWTIARSLKPPALCELCQQVLKTRKGRRCGRCK
jgi:hypothetical protein